MAKGLLYTGHRIPVLVFVAQNKNTLVITSLGINSAGNSVPLFRNKEKPHGSLVLRCLTLVSVTSSA